MCQSSKIDGWLGKLPAGMVLELKHALEAVEFDESNTLMEQATEALLDEKVRYHAAVTLGKVEMLRELIASVDRTLKI